MRQEGVEERVETAVDVGETGARDLHHDDPRGHRQVVLDEELRDSRGGGRGGEVLDEEGDVKGEPADGEDGDDDDDHARDASLGQHRLTPSRRRCSRCSRARRRTPVRTRITP